MNSAEERAAQLEEALKLVALIDAHMTSGPLACCVFGDARSIARHLRAFSADEWREIAAAADLTPPSRETTWRVIQVYEQRAQLPDESGEYRRVS